METETLESAALGGISSPRSERLKLRLRGAVQGVGFRPFVYRLAHALRLAGWVENSAQGVTIDVEGPSSALGEFRRRLVTDKPPRAIIQGVEATHLDPVGSEGFTVRTSDDSGQRTALVLPDVATCPDCLQEVFDSRDRRHRYPFTNCTNCGPRYSIVMSLPYDRTRTTMSRFPMCDRCRAEYEDPADRRFHAEPNACPVCGPHLELWDGTGRPLAAGDEALLAAVEEIRAGRIVAVKGLGGFHLVVDARREGVVRELRRRKRREMKPFAVMVPSLAEARARCHISTAEEALLTSPEAPVTLLRRRDHDIAPSVAPGNPYLGILLPYTPLHHLLLRELDSPVVATSGNISDEPICTDERKALEQLAGIADMFLVHDRGIVRHVDDSVARVVMGRELILRRARGYAPLPVCAASSLQPVLAVGAHLKNSVAISVGGQVFLSPHIGDLESEPAFETFRATIEALDRLYEFQPSAVACDAHPDYLSTQYARRGPRPVVAVQHHYAHILAGMADNDLQPPILGFAWDGSGYGLDGTIWGGETLRVTANGFQRLAWMRPFLLPGGDKAVREPRRSALGALYELHGASALDGDRPPASFFSRVEREVLGRMLDRRVNTQTTSSAGRLFDAVAALAGLHPVARFEGQAAMALEFAMDGLRGDESYPFEVRRADPKLGQAWILDWGPMLDRIDCDVRAGLGPARVSLRFHNTLAEMIVETARRFGEERIVLSGGCFQNRYLTERAIQRLLAAGFRPYWHQRIPPNDGGIAVGQVLAAARAVGEG